MKQGGLRCVADETHLGARSKRRNRLVTGPSQDGVRGLASRVNKTVPIHPFSNELAKMVPTLADDSSI